MITMVSTRRFFGYPERYVRDVPAWLAAYRPDWRDDIELEYLMMNRPVADAARREA